MKIKIDIKPLSVNQCWQGKRFKTPLYESYEQEMMYALPKLSIASCRLKLSVTVGFSSKNADIDNPIKPLLDILQKKYKFNDKQIYRLEIEKKDVKKGEEFIEFEIKNF